MVIWTKLDTRISFVIAMPVLSEKRLYENVDPFSKSKISLTLPSASQKKLTRKKKKGPRLKFRKQFISFASIIEIEKEVDDNPKKSLFEMSMRCADDRSSVRPRQSQSEKLASTKLPTLQRSTSTNNGSSSLSCGPSNTPRVMSGYRVPLTLPANLQPGAFERRKRLPLLSAIKPENERSERERFIRANFNYNPLFIYRFPAEPELLTRLGTPSDKYLKHVSIFTICLSCTCQEQINHLWGRLRGVGSPYANNAIDEKKKKKRVCMP